MKIEKPGLYRTRAGGLVNLVPDSPDWLGKWILRTSSHYPSIFSKWTSNGVPVFRNVGHKDEVIEYITDPVIKAFYDIND